jgi:putative hydrolase of the HAD superfamily
MNLENNNQIKAIFFDAADTLFRVKGGVGNTYSDVARKYGVDSTPVQIEKAFSKAFKSAPPMAFPGVVDPKGIKIREKKWWYEVVKSVFSEIRIFEKFDDYFDELFEVFRYTAWELFPETKDVLESLKKNGFIIGVISNFDSRIYDVCANLGIIGYFDSFVISSETGFAKPFPEIFSLALKRNKVYPFESIHIGDSLQLDFYAARALGINSVLIDREGRYKTRNDVVRIKSLTEVTRLVDSK